MSRSNLLSLLRPLEGCAIQPYFSRGLSLSSLIEWVIEQIGPSEIIISTFSTSEEFIRRVHRLRMAGRISRCDMICDLRAAKKTATLWHFMKAAFDRVSLSENHSKVVLISSASMNVAIVTSQNQTRGDRYEAGIITTDPLTFNFLRTSLEECTEKSVLISEFILQQRNS